MQQPGGNLAKQIREWFRQAADPQTEQDIVEEAVTIGSKTGEVYAPDIMARNERYLVFGNLRGILVYDLQKDRLLGSIDTQKRLCLFWDIPYAYKTAAEKQRYLCF